MLASLFAQPLPRREQVFISWAGLRGAVPIVLATIPLAEGVVGAEKLFDIVFVMVVIYTLLTARRCRGSPPAGCRRRDQPRDLDVEAAPLERVAADLLQIRSPEVADARRRGG